MRSFVFAIIAFVALAAFATPSAALQAVPEFTLNLDLPPRQRWNGAVQQIVALHGYNNSIGPVVAMYAPVFSLIAPEVGPPLISHLQTYFPDTLEEMYGLQAQLVQAGCSECADTNLMAGLTYFYELSHIGSLKKLLPPGLLKSCTGILAVPTNASAPMIHGRNMDESPQPGRNITMRITVTRNNATLYYLTDWTWLAGGGTATTSSARFTSEMNWRDLEVEPSLSAILGVILNPKTIPVLQIYRVLQEQQATFDDAVKTITTATPFGSPFYGILSGPGRVGAVVTIGFNTTTVSAPSAGLNFIYTINATSTPAYLVQTNYDLNLPDPPSDPRRTVAENALAMLGPARAGTELGVWMALSTYPVHNRDTMFTALMSVESVPELYIRRSMSPEA